MPATLRAGLRAMFFGLCLLASATALADETQQPSPGDEDRRESMYYQQPTYRADARAIIHQKAQARAFHRITRLETRYYFDNYRPTLTPTPWMSPYVYGRPVVYWASAYRPRPVLILR